MERARPRSGPLVSVIIPAYNAGAFIADALRSVLEQSYAGPIQALVIDDGSTDDTTSVVEEWARRDDRVVLRRNVREKGPSGARNTGLVHAQGEYFAFLDADDTWAPNHLQEAVDFLQRRTEIDVVFFNCAIVDLRTKRRIGDWFSNRRFTRSLSRHELEPHYFLITADMFEALLDESFVHLQSTVVRQSTIRGLLFNEQVRRAEDRDFSINLFVKRHARFAYRDIETGTYFIRDDSLTTESIDNALATALDHIKLFSAYAAQQGLAPAIKKKLRTLLFERHLALSYCYRKLGLHGCAANALVSSIRYGVNFTQSKELAKIIASYGISAFRPALRH